MTQGKLAADAALPYMLAGKATVTVANTATGNRFTYRIARCTDKPGKPAPAEPLYFVSLLTGSDNEGDYRYLGIIRGTAAFALTAKSCAGPDALSVKAFAYVHGRLTVGQPLAATVEVWHEGRCGRCGRLLTVPESIERGIGPECAAIMGA